jgi:hypothetical protein
MKFNKSIITVVFCAVILVSACVVLATNEKPQQEGAAPAPKPKPADDNVDSDDYAGSGQSKTELQEAQSLRAAMRSHSDWADTAALDKPYYSHGGGMGYAGDMLKNRRWSFIAKYLTREPVAHVWETPEDGEPISTGGIIKAFENNPVVSAFGCFTSCKVKSQAKHNGQCDKKWEVDLFVHPDATPENPRVDDILVAHGLPLHLGQEAIGRSSYTQVADTPLSKFGGLKLSEWKNVYTRALTLASTSLKEFSNVPTEFTWKQFIEAYRGLGTSNEYPTVVLDVKTGMKTLGRHNDALLAAIIRGLNKRGMHVEAVGSFKWDQVKNLKTLVPTQEVHVEGLNKKSYDTPVEPVLFFHGIEESKKLGGVLGKQVLDAYEQDGAASDQTVMFNGGFLLVTNHGIKSGDGRYSVWDKAVERLERVRKRRNLRVGIYVQEYGIDAEAVDVLVKLVNSKPDLFEIGFAWGGPAGKWYSEITKADGTATQAIFGHNRDNYFAPLTRAKDKVVEYAKAGGDKVKEIYGNTKKAVGTGLNKAKKFFSRWNPFGRRDGSF